MSFLVNVGISNRHIHLTEEMYNELFNEEFTIKKELSQPGEFASNQTVIISGPKGEIYHVRVMGPFRKYNQVEVSQRDARELGIEPPVRASGDLNNSENLTIIGPKGQKYLKNCCIIPNRHLHISEEKALEKGLKDKQKITAYINGPKSGEVDLYVKIQKNSVTEIHLDTDDGNAFQINQNDQVVVKI